MSKVKEISEEKFLVLGELGMPVYWDVPPFYDHSRIASDLEYATLRQNREFSRFVSYDAYIRDKQGLRNGVRFYTLVEEE